MHVAISHQRIHVCMYVIVVSVAVVAETRDAKNVDAVVCVPVIKTVGEVPLI